MLLALYLTTTIAAADTTLAAEPPPASAPAVLVHRQPSMPLVSLRMSILASDPPAYAGAGHLIQHVMHPRLRDRVARVGGQARMERSSDAIVYTVTGPAVELDYLADALRSVLEPPTAATVQLLRASQELAEERLAEWETAGLHARAALRSLVFPNDAPVAGTGATARRLTRPGELETAWSLIYSPERVSIVAVGDVELRSVEAAFAELPPAPVAPKAIPDDEPSATPAPPAAAEATRGWLGVAYPAHGLSPAGLSVAARIAGDLLKASIPDAAVEAEHWSNHHGQALVLLVAAPGPDLETARTALGTALRDAAAAVTDRSVARAANSLRREMLFYSRTPDRMAEVLGRFSDANGDPGAAQRFYTELEAVRARDVARLLDELLDQTPFRVEIPPQRTPGR